VEIRRGGRREKEEIDMPTGCSRIKGPPPGARRGKVKETERKKRKRNGGKRENRGMSKTEGR